MALGYFPYAELAAAPARKLPSASVGFCLDVVVAKPQRGPFSVHRYGSLYINGVMVSEPEIYDDDRYVVHGLHGFIPPLSRVSCVEDDAHAHHHHQFHLRHHHLSARSAATSTATGASVVRIMIWEAISRLRVSGFGVVALAMRVKFAELEKLSNLTVFALDDRVIFTGGGHGYVSAVRFHIVPGHRLTRADLLLLRPGTVLPTLAGEDQKLVITLGAGSATEEVCINKVPVKEPDVVINSRVAVHGIYIPFPRLHLAASVAVASDLHTRPKRDGAARPRQLASSGRHSEGFRVSSKLGRRDAGADKAGGRRAFASVAAAAGGAALVVLAALAVNRHRVKRKRKQREVRQERVMMRKLKKLQQKPDPTACSACSGKDIKWKASGCGLKFCNNCLEEGFLDSHDVCLRGSFFCHAEDCGLEPLEALVLAPGNAEYVLVGEERISATTITKKYLKLDDLQERKSPKSLSITYLKSDNRVLAVRRRSP